MDAAHLFHPDHLDDYDVAVRSGLDTLREVAAGVTAPATGVDPAEAARRVGEVDLDQPLGDPAAVLDEVRRVWLDDAVWFHDPSYVAHLNCPVVIPALVAEALLSAVNSSLDTFDQSVGGTFVERRLVSWTAGRIGYDQTRADGVFTSGGSQSNLQALHLARDRSLAEGANAARLRVFASGDAHFSVQKSARLLGLGERAVVPVAVDGDRRMDPHALAHAMARAVADGAVPCAVVATAGTTDFGAIDPLPEIAGLARAYGAWLHVDAAYGGGLLVSQRRRHLLDGVERADSVTVDYHKTWFQPVSCSAIVVRDTRALRHVTWHADYLNPAGTDRPNQVDKSLQTTRRFDALKLWMTLRTMGPDLVGDYLDAVIDLAEATYPHLLVADDLEVAAAPSLSTLVLRYRPRGLTESELSESDTARVNAAIRQRLYDEGRAMVAATTVDGRSWLKLTLLNPATTVDDVLRVVEAIRGTGAAVLADVLAEGPDREEEVA